MVADIVGMEGDIDGLRGEVVLAATFCKPVGHRQPLILADTADEIGASYYDFNLCRYEYLDTHNSDFLDLGHLNQYGAEKFSRVFGEFFAGDIDGQSLFYDTYAEKRERGEAGR